MPLPEKKKYHLENEHKDHEMGKDDDNGMNENEDDGTDNFRLGGFKPNLPFWIIQVVFCQTGMPFYWIEEPFP